MFNPLSIAVTAVVTAKYYQPVPADYTPADYPEMNNIYYRESIMLGIMATVLSIIY